MNKVYKVAYIRRTKDISNSKWELWNNKKIIIAGMTRRIESCYWELPLATGVGTYIIYDTGNFNPKFILGLLNSKFLSYYLKEKFKDKHMAGGYIAINKSTIEQLPIPPIATQNQPIVTQIESLISQILFLTQSPDYETNQQKQEQVKALEKQIDQLVYKLYNLTDEEIKIIENCKNE